MTKSSPEAVKLPAALHAAVAHHDFGLLATEQQMLSEPASAQTALLYPLIACQEPWARIDVEATAKESVGSYYAQTYMAGLPNQLTACPYVPKADVGPGSLHAQTPVLFVQGGADPQDPPENVAGATSQLPRSVTVVVPWAGHSWAWDGCLVSLVNTTLASGSISSEGATCVGSAAPPPFYYTG